MHLTRNTERNTFYIFFFLRIENIAFCMEMRS